MRNKFAFLPENAERIYFSGILGVSLSTLALIAAERGYTVLGSDIGDSPETLKRLTESGIKVYPTQSAENVRGFDVFVYSAAISENDPELEYARSAGMQVLTRAELLGSLISEYTNRIGISGTHGKSTVSGMLTEIFLTEKRDITALIGAESIDLCGSFRIGSGDTAVYEACEYKRSFLRFPPTLAVVLNIEREHTDCYPELSDAIEAYASFAESARAAVLCLDDEGCRMLGRALSAPKVLYYSLESSEAELYAENICCTGGYYSFDAVFKGKRLFSARLKVPGIHNVKNALAAAGAAYLSGVDPRMIGEGLSRFSGMKRRLEYIGECRGAAVYDDYAHHPTEIRASLECARTLGFKKIICAFQPHTYSRTAAFFKEFTEAFSAADTVVFTDIFAAREENTCGVSGRALAEATENGIYISALGEIKEYLEKRAEPGTLIITMGAGRLNAVAKALTAKN